MQLKFNQPQEEETHFSQELYQNNFRIRIGKNKNEKILQRLANPKYHQSLSASTTKREI